ncbi:MAG: cell division protein FtsA [Candidatus Hydrogenedentes bacterium CG07_land_8_20_14_0_80_42_17]|nr:MAG: cell division protein FtsA [Candidatus Hydrogenedentes bacterium CG1_02_42_14]PIU48381.1 MAG: cell division protein FtsA [Candidatus Hydrogenedentes bacterium CG07_land_8_20_14_0_80_42_17]
MSAQRDRTVVGLDIGTTKVCAIIGEVNEQGIIEIIGVGQAPSNGLHKGVVINLESTVKSITKAIEEAEMMSGTEVSSVYVGIAGGHIKGINSRGVVAITRPDREITQSDVDRVIDAARAVSIPMDREVIHVLAQEFIVDDQDGIKDPIGMAGVRLEAEVHIVTGAVTSAQNIVRSVNRAGFEVDDIVLEPLASSFSVLTEDEKELGVVLVDIGGGTTDMALFVEGAIWQTEVLSVGGGNVTKDISVGLRTPIAEAEQIKLRYGCATTSLAKQDEVIEVPSVGGRKSKVLPRQVLAEIIQPRMEEIFLLLSREIKKTGYEDLVAGGVVLTGGASAMEGIQELAEQILDLPVRIGSPKGISGLVDVVNSPVFATGVGLAFYGSKNIQVGGGRSRSNLISGGGDLFRGITNRMKDWFGEFFS